MRMVSSVRKVATNVSLPAALVKRARQAEINLSELLERATEAELRIIDRQKWLDENRDAIESYNEQVLQRGVFSDGLRRF
jgi:antitoxin CcdA